MSTSDLIKNITTKINKYKYLILICSLIFAGIFYYQEHNKRTIYTSKASLFPLNSESGSSTSSIGGLLGLSDENKSFGNESSINIIELTLSRTLMQSVAAKHLTGFGGKTIAELLVEETNNAHTLFFTKIIYPTDSISQNVLGGALIKSSFIAKLNKNNVLELYYSNTNPALLEPITNTIISEITKFYTHLKIEKALADYNFTILKLDSVQIILNKLDNRAISLQSSTLFTPEKLLTFQIPKDYVADSKVQAIRERDILINNKEEATWRLQKITPIVEVLDKPAPPYESVPTTPRTMLIIGFILGAFIGILLAISGVLYTYAKSEISKMTAPKVNLVDNSSI